MTISKDIKQNPAACSSKSTQLAQKKTWDGKRNLAKKRLMSLSQNMKEGFDDMDDRPVICNKVEEKTTNGTTNTYADASTSAIDRAQEFQENLPQQFPSFTKSMLKSHISGGFWLGLPAKFCVEHLPKEDATIYLVDENDKSHETKYLGNKNGLSAGWKGFSIKHELMDGDVLIFQLIETCTFKVYIVRASRLTELDGAICLLTLDAKPCNDTEMEDKPDEEIYKELILVSDENEERHKDEPPILISDEEDAVESEETYDNSCSENVEGIRFSESVLNFKDIKSFQDFSVHVDDLILDSEIPTHIIEKYYTLCCSQNMFLHEPLIRGLNIQLATGIIFETITIADAIKVVKSTTPQNLLESWDRTLKAFQDLGMVVGFLRDRTQKLLGLSRASAAVIEVKRIEKAEAEIEMRSLKEKLSKVGTHIKELDTEICDLTVTADKNLSTMFMEVAGASW